ncbi:hypothetical protein GON03_19125 [Nocardioides sp. MAH-18]|uniref:Uncharacterized protein n=1 Tax=Nocardioides agri TaxID=2682843 RepID=A0A6L6XVT1_9ACTN|nr:MULTISPECIES: hypothetical protein [unclassified Nocardioides]MBA2952130.1 hypothetical protein [Nocardioides sp. CGMCC 1.13656]MVQ51299.1 hypothetical protein [Nocardioides sp. MAH-18]
MSVLGKHVVLVHPDDVNLADAKALAAQHDTTVVGNRFVPRGQLLLVNPALWEWRP